MKLEHPSTEEIIDYLHRELTPEADAAMLAHIETCAQCGVRYENEARLSEAMRSFARASERELPPGVVARIWESVDSQPSAFRWVSRLSAFWRPLIATPIAVALALAIYFGYANHARGPQTTIDAAYYLDDHAALTGTVPFSEGIVVPSSLENDATGSDQHWLVSANVEGWNVYAAR